MKNNTNFNLTDNNLRTTIRYYELLWKKEIFFNTRRDVGITTYPQIILISNQTEIENIQCGYIPKRDGNHIIFSPILSLLKIENANTLSSEIKNHLEFINIHKGNLSEGTLDSLEGLTGQIKTVAEELLYRRMMNSLETNSILIKNSRFLKLAEKQVIQERLETIENELMQIIYRERDIENTKKLANKDEIIKRAIVDIENLVKNNLYAEINFTMAGIEAITNPIVLAIDYHETRAFERLVRIPQYTEMNITNEDIRYYCIGTFRIIIPWSGSNISVVPIKRNTDKFEWQLPARDVHPHVSSGNPCLGGIGGKTVKKAMAEGDIKGALIHMYKFINDYNPKDPYSHIPEKQVKAYSKAEDALKNANLTT